MSEQVLYDVQCRACPTVFKVHPAYNAAHVDANLCMTCRAFRTMMEDLMKPREIEKSLKVHERNRNLTNLMNWLIFIVCLIICIVIIVIW